MLHIDTTSAFAIFIALFLGGMLKGATGAGAPVVAVPVMAAFLDVRLAVIIMVMPNVITNLWQSWRFRRHRTEGNLTVKLAIGGALGAFVGTFLLANLPAKTLSLVMAAAVFGYVVLRVARPGFRLSLESALPMALPVGTAGGILQGAAGISAPITISFLNAMRLERPVFIFTISVFFTAMSLFQLFTMIGYGLMTPVFAALGMIALLPLFLGMPVGGLAARYLSADSFDRVMLVVLVMLALRLAYTALA